MQTRIYFIYDRDDSWLIEATSQAQAIRFLTRAQYTVEVASPKTIASMMGSGHKIIDATKEKNDGE